jgi:hypothetical protein
MKNINYDITVNVDLLLYSKLTMEFYGLFNRVSSREIFRLRYAVNNITRTEVVDKIYRVMTPIWNSTHYNTMWNMLKIGIDKKISRNIINRIYESIPQGLGGNFHNLTPPTL